MSEKKRALWEYDDSLYIDEESIEEKTVFQEELVHIKARRDEKYPDPNDAIDSNNNLDLVGLAFSGGGIRSAIFGLGVLEALKEKSLLKGIDYLSTVSGGGYIGAWLSANCKRASDCEIMFYFVSHESEKQQLINQFRLEFTPNNNVYTVLIMAEELKWTIAGFNDNRKFKEVVINDDGNELALELNKIKSPADSTNKLIKTIKTVLQEKSEKAVLIDVDQEDVDSHKIIKLASSSIDKTPPSSWLDKDVNWKKSIDHLRRNSNYLSPKLGFFSADTWSIAMVWLRNTLLIQLLIIFAIASLLILPRFVYVFYQSFLSDQLYQSVMSAWYGGAIALYILVIVSIASNLLRINDPDSSYLTVNDWKVKLSGAVTFLLLAWLVAISNNYNFVSPTFNDSPFYLATLVTLGTKPFIAVLLVMAGFYLLPTLARLRNLIWAEDKYPIKQINYTQKYVQYYVILPMLIFSLLFSAVLQQLVNDNEVFGSTTFLGIFWNTFILGKWPVSIFVIFISLWLLSICSIKGCKWTKKTYFVSWFLAPLIATFALQAMFSGVLYFLLQNWGDSSYQRWTAFVLTAPLLLYAFSLVVTVLIGMVGRESSEAVREWWSRYSAWLAIYGFCWMMIVIIAVYGPLLSAMLLNHHNLLSGGVSFTWVATTVAGIIASKSSSTGGVDNQKSKSKWQEFVAKIAPFVFVIGLLLLISTGLHYVFALISAKEGIVLSVEYFDKKHWDILSNVKIENIVLILGGCLIGILLLALRVDINVFSLNAFYRNRLVRCFLGATRFRKRERHPQYFTGFDEMDDLKMADLIDPNKKKVPIGLFHIVNCALNLGGSKDLSLHTRHSAIFTLTPLRCGSSYKSKDHLGYLGGKEREVGYIATNVYGGKANQPTLGQAISISGAAASPNMGYHTSPVVAFLMTLFNARLGWWFPNPDKSSAERPSPDFSLTYLVKELLGVANEKSEFLAISDGGHFENLAVYELIKRKCKVIIMSDAECDPEMQFEGLGKLIRMCEVDLDAKITIDVSSIQMDNDARWSHNRCTIGEVEYSKERKPDGPETGWLIYLKASMNGKENTAIKQYKATHPTFPHETTGDQFYGEDQFESYRSLGRDIAEKVFASVSGGDDFASLAEKLYFHDKQKIDQETS